MIMNNDNKKLSRNGKRRIIQKVKMNDNMRLLLNKNKTRKKKNKNSDTNKELERDLFMIKYAKNPKKLLSELNELNEIRVVKKKLHEIKNELLLDYTGEFEMIGNLKVGGQIRQTHIRFRKNTDYEAYINSIDEGYDAEDVFSMVILTKSILLRLI